MWYVYIIRSVEFPEPEYIGATEDLKRRLPERANPDILPNSSLGYYCAFPDKLKALAFEK